MELIEPTLNNISHLSLVLRNSLNPLYMDNLSIDATRSYCFSVDLYNFTKL